MLRTPAAGGARTVAGATGRARGRRRGDAGFSLIEIAVVLVIIGILAAVAVGFFVSQRSSARGVAVRNDLRNLALAVEAKAGAPTGYRAAFRSGIGQGSALVTDGVANATYLLVPFRGSDNVSIVMGRTTGTGALSATQYCLVAYQMDVGTGVWWVYSKRLGGMRPNPYATQALARAAC